MKRLFSKYEWVLLLIAISPLFLTGWYWEQIPTTIPTHYNIWGTADAWAGKQMLLWFVPTIIFGLYALLLLVPIIDPKQRIAGMGRKYFAIRAIVTSLITAIMALWVYSIANEVAHFMSLLFPTLAIFLVVLGIYLQAIKPNYFLGIRTPWALNDEQNWLLTHRFGGRVYIIGGITLFIASMLGLHQGLSVLFFASLIAILTVPYIYSYYYYVNSKKHS